MSAPSREDLVQLEQNYLEALNSIGEIKWTEEFPDYPESVVHFMCYILGSAWVDRDYSPRQSPPAPIPAEPSTVADIQSSLTALASSERFAAGSWKRTMEADQIKPLIDRAKQIMP